MVALKGEVMRRTSTVVLVALAVLVLPLAGRARVREPAWAPVTIATIRPGVQTLTERAQCTANFVFYDGAHVYLGQAAHCAGTDGSTATDGCEAGVLPRGTRVRIDGASRPGVIVYNSWETMQRIGEADPDACAYNDFALIRLARADRLRVNPSIPSWGGPAGLSRGAAFGEAVYSFGHSSLWLGLTPMHPHQGVLVGERGDGWAYKVYTAPPGIPGDSGSPYLDADGRALGVLSTVEILPYAASNNVTSLRAALRYMRAHSGLDRVRLARGTEAFNA